MVAVLRDKWGVKSNGTAVSESPCKSSLICLLVVLKVDSISLARMTRITMMSNCLP